MKIEFDDKSYIEVTRSNVPGKVIVVIGARDQQNPLKKIINCVEIDENQLKDLINI